MKGWKELWTPPAPPSHLKAGETEAARTQGGRDKPYFGGRVCAAVLGGREWKELGLLGIRDISRFWASCASTWPSASTSAHL